MILSRIYAELINFLFPAYCVICRTPLGSRAKNHVCIRCLSEVKLVREPYCRHCGHPLVGRIETCGSCRNTPPVFEKIYTVGVYSGVLKELIHHFKFRNRGYLRYVLGEMLYRCYREEMRVSAGLITSVPMSQDRLNERGYNQSALLASYLSEKTGVDCDNSLLFRTRRTRPQYRLSYKERLGNVKGVFSVSSGKDIKGLSVLCIDDVYTSGSTMEECALAIRAAGAGHVYGLVLARG